MVNRKIKIDITNIVAITDIKQKIDEIYKGKSDINPYGATNKSEFFAVISEYFFERPKLLQDKHPELYGYLEKIFHVDLANRIKDHKK